MSFLLWQHNPAQEPTLRAQPRNLRTAPAQCDPVDATPMLTSLPAHLPACPPCWRGQKYGKSFDELEGRERQSVGGTVGGQIRKEQMANVGAAAHAPSMFLTQT